MARRIGYFFVGAMCIVQAHSLLAADMSFASFLSQMILNPIDFLVVSLLFLIGFLMFSSFFHHIIQICYLQIIGRSYIQKKDILEMIIFSVLFVLLFRFSFWLTFLASIFAVVFGVIATDSPSERATAGRNERRR